MKLIRLKTSAGVSSLQLCEEDPPVPKSGEVLVRWHACSLNPHDEFVVSGAFPVSDGRIPLSDTAGEVLALGDAVSDLCIGDTVVSTFYPYWVSGEMTTATRRDIPGETVDGYAREYACMPAHALTRTPRCYSFAQAATLPCAGVTAWRGLVVQGNVKPGDTVLVMGTGAVSLFALQFAKAAGARVIATSSSEEKLSHLKQLGADEVINYKATAKWGERAKAITHGRGVDHVIEVGGPATFAQSISACRLGGHIAVIGVLSGFAAEISLPAIFSAQLRLSGISVGNRADQQDMIRAIDAHQLKPVIDRTFGLEEIDAAFTCFQSRSHFGKIIIHI